MIGQLLLVNCVVSLKSKLIRALSENPNSLHGIFLSTYAQTPRHQTFQVGPCGIYLNQDIHEYPAITNIQYYICRRNGLVGMWYFSGVSYLISKFFKACRVTKKPWASYEAKFFSFRALIWEIHFKWLTTLYTYTYYLYILFSRPTVHHFEIMRRALNLKKMGVDPTKTKYPNESIWNGKLPSEH